MAIINKTKNNYRYYIISIANLFYMFWHMSVIIGAYSALINEEEKEESSTNAEIFTLLIHAMWLGLDVFGWVKQSKNLNLSVATTASELSRTSNCIKRAEDSTLLRSLTLREMLNIFVTKPSLRKRLGLNIKTLAIGMYPAYSHPNRICISFAQFEGKNWESTFVWDIGKEQMFQVLNRLKGIISEIEKLSITEWERKYINKKLGFPFGIKSLLLPHKSHCIDFPTKTRYWTYLTAPAYDIIDFLIKFNVLSEDSFYQNYVILSAIMLFLAVAESYTLNNSRLRLNLEGFTNYYRSYISTTPTCVGQQLSEELILSGRNRNLIAAVRYIRNCHEFLNKLGESTKSQLSHTARRNIDAFCEIVTHGSEIISDEKGERPIPTKMFSLFNHNFQESKQSKPNHQLRLAK